MPQAGGTTAQPAAGAAYATTYRGEAPAFGRVLTVSVRPHESRLRKILTMGATRGRTAPARWMPGDDEKELVLMFSEKDAMRVGLRPGAEVTLPGPVQAGRRLHGEHRIVTACVWPAGGREVRAITRDAEREIAMIIFGSIETGRTYAIPKPRTKA